MDVRLFIFGVIFFVPVVALIVVMLANRFDRREDMDDEPTFIYVLPAIPGSLVGVVGLLSVIAWASVAVLHADVPLGDPCELLEPYSWRWYLLGCLWGS